MWAYWGRFFLYCKVTRCNLFDWFDDSFFGADFSLDWFVTVLCIMNGRWWLRFDLNWYEPLRLDSKVRIKHSSGTHRVKTMLWLLLFVWCSRNHASCNLDFLELSWAWGISLRLLPLLFFQSIKCWLEEYFALLLQLLLEKFGDHLLAMRFYLLFIVHGYPTGLVLWVDHGLKHTSLLRID